MKKILFLASLVSSFVFALNLNTASMQDLEKIKGIGPKKAQAIIEYRKHHKIKNADDLKNIKGFNNKIISNIKNNVLTKKHIKNKKTFLKEKKNKLNKKKHLLKNKVNKKTAAKNSFKNKKSKLNKKKNHLKNKFRLKTK